MLKRISYSLAASLLMLLLLFMRYPASISQPDTVRIGYVGISAQQADLSQQRAAQCGLRGVELMAEQAEQEGRFSGKSTEILSFAVAGEQGWQDLVLQALRERQLSALFFAPDAPFPSTLRNELEAAGCPCFLASDTGQLTDTAGAFRVVSTRRAMTKTLAEYARSQHFRRVTVLVSDETEMKEQANLFIQCLKEGQVRSDAHYSFSPSDYYLIGDEQAPEAFSVWGDKDFLIQTIRALRRAGYLGPILGSPDCGQAAVMDALGIASNNVVFTAQYCIPRSTEEIEGETLSALTERYLQRYGEYPASSALFSGYDQMLLFSEAFSVQLERPELTLPQAVHTLQDIKGMAGIFNFSSGPDGIDRPRVYTIESGAVIPVL